ncbi:hypothetical protein L208DRAFT_1323377 [Tricholoma matsutake]|nr:hypothetical protein L208DRAFT_1323377 [Tricholoma matsutake 945]
MPARGHLTAPKFDSAHPHELHRFFDELEILFRECTVTDIALMKKHACRYLDIDSSELWESLPEFAPGTDFDTFRLAVHALYPGSDDNCKWSFSDMDKLISEQLRIGIHSSTDLGTYFRSFYNITQYLRSKNRISETKQSRAFIHGFELGLWARIAHRLELRFPDHYPDDPYTLNNIHLGAKFVLACSDTSQNTQATSPSNLASISSPASSTSTSAPSTYVKFEDISSILDKFGTTIVNALTVSKFAPTSRNDPRAHHDHSENFVCLFCGQSSNYIGECLTCQAYIMNGKCKKNAEGKVVLPNSQFMPRNIPGHFIKDRIDELLRQNPGVCPSTSPSLMYDIAPSPISSQSPRNSYQILNFTNNLKARILALEKEIFALHKTTQFDRSDPPLVPAHAPHDSSEIPHILPHTKTVREMSTSASSTAITHPVSTSASRTATHERPASTLTLSSQPRSHPFANTRENSCITGINFNKNAYLPPQEQNFGTAPKPCKDSSYHSHHGSVQHTTIAWDIFDCTMNVPIAMLNLEELLLLSPKLHMKYRDQITLKQVAQQDHSSMKVLETNSTFIPIHTKCLSTRLSPRSHALTNIRNFFEKIITAKILRKYLSPVTVSFAIPRKRSLFTKKLFSQHSLTSDFFDCSRVTSLRYSFHCLFRLSFNIRKPLNVCCFS